MRIKNNILATVAIITLSYYKTDVNCLNLPTFEELKQKLAKKLSSYDYKKSNVSRSSVWERELSKSFAQKSEASSDTKGMSAKRLFSGLTGSLSKEFPPNFRRNYAYFMLLFAFLVLYAVVGYHRNKRLATKWAEEIMPVLDDNFAYVERDNGPLDVQGWNCFEMYASGRTSCKGFLMRLDLVKRQCFWHENLIRIFFPNHDTVTFESQFESLDPFLMAVCQKVENKAFVETYPHLLHFSTVYEPKDVPDRYRVYVSSNDRSVLQFANYVLQKLQPFLPYLEFFYVSDLLTLDARLEKKPLLCCRFRLPKKSSDYAALTKTLVNFVDMAKNFTLPPKLRESVTKERSELEVTFNKLNKSLREEPAENKSDLTSEKAKKLEERMVRKNKPLTNFKIKEDIERLKKLREQGLTTKRNLEESLEFKNPYLLEKIMGVFNINGYSSNYSKDIYDPSVYEALSNEPLENKEKPKERRRHKSGWSENNK